MKIFPRKTLLNPNLVRPYAIDSSPRDAKKIWLDKNENLDPILLSISEEVLRSIPVLTLASYPEAGEAYRKLALIEEVPPESLLFTAGSDGAIRLTFEAFVGDGDAVIHTSPTFAMYEIYCQMFGASVTAINYEMTNISPELDIDKLIESIRQVKPKLLCIPNPDSPTGAHISLNSLEGILKVCEEVGSVLLVDEAYYPFCKVTAMPWIKKSKNLIVARTFAKAWGAAGLRIGYAAAHPETIKYLHKMRPMYEVSTLAIEYVKRLLDYQHEMLMSVDRMLKSKKYFIEQMEALGFNTLKTEGNFVHVAFREKSALIHSALKNKFLYKKFFEHPALNGFTRFTVGPLSVMTELKNAINSAVKVYK